MVWRRVAVVAAVLAVRFAFGAQQRTLPAMGYNTWNDVRCEGVSEARLLALAGGLVESGFAAKGYAYLNIDDCWQEPFLGDDGRLVPSKAAFPNGLSVVVDGAHRLGLKVGLYADRGFKTCAFRAGSRGREDLHAAQFAAWGVDYLKYDSCYSPNLSRAGAIDDYLRMRDALAAHAPSIRYSLCGWSAWYAPAMAEESGVHSWRVGADCDEWANVYEVARSLEALSSFAGPALGYNDPDMLVGTTGGGAIALTPDQSRTQFSLWAVAAAPLLLGTPPDAMSAWDAATYGNERVIAVDQDPLGIPGKPAASTCPAKEPKDNWWCSPWSMPRDVFEMWLGGLRTLAATLAVLGAAAGYRGRRRSARGFVAAALVALAYGRVLVGYRPRVDACVQVWARPLADTGVALLFVNWGPDAATVDCDARCLRDAGILGNWGLARFIGKRSNPCDATCKAGGQAAKKVVDLVSGEALPPLGAGGLTFHVAGGGASRFVKVGGHGGDPADWPGPWGDLRGE